MYLNLHLIKRGGIISNIVTKVSFDVEENMKFKISIYKYRSTKKYFFLTKNNIKYSELRFEFPS